MYFVLSLSNGENIFSGKLGNRFIYIFVDTPYATPFHATTLYWFDILEAKSGINNTENALNLRKTNMVFQPLYVVVVVVGDGMRW